MIQLLVLGLFTALVVGLLMWQWWAGVLEDATPAARGASPPLTHLARTPRDRFGPQRRAA